MTRISLVVLCLLAPTFAVPKAVRLWSRSHGRVVGGTETTIAEHPWHVALLMEDEYRCGASLFGTNWVLTAAHCVVNVDPSLLSVRAGSTTKNSGGTVIDVAQAVTHRYYYSPAGDYDIAALQTSESFTLGSEVKLVGLPENGYDPPGGLAVTLTGWGRIAQGGSSPTNLNKVDINVIDRDTCQTAIVAGTKITKRMICAGEAGKSSCSGDSGSPLVSGTTQVGIVSWGVPNCQESPGAFSNVGELRSWITDTTEI